MRGGLINREKSEKKLLKAVGHIITAQSGGQEPQLRPHIKRGTFGLKYRLKDADT
jgi:hypothetical protein